MAPGSLATTPTNPHSSGTVTVMWNDQNQGDGAVNAAFNDSVLVQQVNSGSGLTTIATGTVSGDATLAAGATSAQQQFAFTLPDGAAGVGNFLVTVTTDSGQTVKEYDSNGNPAYGNNSASITTTSKLANYADLIVAPGSIATYARKTALKRHGRRSPGKTRTRATAQSTPRSTTRSSSRR